MLVWVRDRTKLSRTQALINLRLFANIFFGCATFFVILFFWLSIAPSNVEGKTENILNLISALVCVFIYVVSIIYGLWEVRLKDEDVEYRKTGKKEKLDEITTHIIS